MKKWAKFLLGLALLSSASLTKMDATEFLEMKNGEVRELWYNIGINYDYNSNFLSRQGDDERIVSERCNISDYDYEEFVEKIAFGELEQKIRGESLDFFINASLEDNNLVFLYGNNGIGGLDEKEKKEIGFSNVYYNETRGSTNLYLLLPDDVTIVENNQILLERNLEDGRIYAYEGVPAKETNMYTRVQKLNEIFDVALGGDGIDDVIDGIKNKEFNIILDGLKGIVSDPLCSTLRWLESKVEEKYDYVDTEDEYLSLLKKIPGKWGAVVNSTIFLASGLEEIAERNRRKGINSIVDGDYNVYSVPLYIQDDVDIYRSKWIGRGISLDLEFDDYKDGDGYLIVSNIGFCQDNGSGKRADIGDIVFALDFNKE